METINIVATVTLIDKNKLMATKTNWRNRIIGNGEMPASQFQANPSNWRIHPKAQRQALAGILDEVGWVQNVIVNKTTGNVIDGHARIEEALRFGDDTLVPFVAVELNEDEEAKILLTLDPIAAMAGADKANLEKLMRDVETQNAAVMDMISDLAQANKIALDGTNDIDAEPQIDKAEELRVKWGVESGQMWQLGEHRLLCGDSTKAEDVARVMGGEKADAVVTDPPYGLGDTVSDKNNYATYEDTKENLKSIIEKALPLCIDIAPVVVLTSGNKNQDMYPDPSWRMAWFTPAGVGRGPWGFCCWQPVLCYGKDPKLSKVKGSHPDAIVLSEGASSDLHPCAKPIKFWRWLVERCSEKGEKLYEPFSGSGTTIIACEQLGRKCRAIEISPAYVAVAIQRWSDATGKTPVLMSKNATNATS